MSTEQQARLHFLEEAETYFEQIETIILNLNASEQRTQDLDTAMRAAHSIKGTAAMMGFMPLSHIAHQMEDYFKILRARNLRLETTIETLLLQCLDGLRAARQHLYSGESVEQEWLTTHIDPIVHQLRHHLGELTEEDENQLLSAEEEVDISVLVFINGVEEYLGQLENKRSTLRGNALRQELLAGATQLAEYGLMAEIGAFVRLCDSVIHQCSRVNDVELEPFAQQVIQAWKRSHSLVVLGCIEKLPHTIGTIGTEKVEAEAEEVEAIASISPLFQTPSPQTPSLSNLSLPNPALSEQVFDDKHPTYDHHDSVDNEHIDHESTKNKLTDSEFDISADDISNLQAQLAQLDLEQVAQLDPLDPEQSDIVLDHNQHKQTDTSNLDTIPSDLGPTQSIEPLTESTATFTTTTSSSATSSTHSPSPPSTLFSSIHSYPKSSHPSVETTVRIPVAQLQTINQLLSTLILDRNAINFRLEQLQTFAALSKQRVESLNQFNTQLRQWYDRASIEGHNNTANQESFTSTTGDLEQPQSMASNYSTSALSGSSSTLSSLAKIAEFDTLELDYYSNLHVLAQGQIETIVKLQEVTTDIDLGLREIGQVTSRLNYTSRSLQEQVNRAQMRPFEDIVGRFPRFIRDLSAQYGKKVNLIVDGETTLFERYALEVLTDPLLHLLRNAFDHGIETSALRQKQGKSPEGTIRLKAVNRGNKTIITVSDDGGGIDLGKIRDRLRSHGIPEDQINQMNHQELLDLIFEPSFSTVDHVTELSGRGVGMDVVRSNLKNINGEIHVSTKHGIGTTFTLIIPMSLSLLRVMFLENNSMVFALPVESVKEILPFEPQQVTIIHGSDHIKWNQSLVPLIHLEAHLQFNNQAKPIPLDGTPVIDRSLIVIVGDEPQPYGLLLKRFWREQDVTIRPISTSLPLPPGFEGATVLGNGRVIPLIEPSELWEWITSDATQSNVNQSGQSPTIFQSSTLLQPNEARQATVLTTVSTILVVDDSIHARQYLAISLEKAGYIVEQAKNGSDAVNVLMAGLQVDAIICDVEMPRLDGYGVLDALRSQPQFQSLPIMMLTSRSSEKHRKLAMNLGASAYFSKPYNEQELLQVLADHLLTCNVDK